MTSPIYAETLIVGAGFAGLSTAYHLAEKGMRNIVLLEQEKLAGTHASGRNAAMIRQSIADPAIANMARQGAETLRKRTPFLKNGSLLLARKEDLAKLEATAATMKQARISFRWFTKKEAEQKVSLLRTGNFEKGLFCPTDGMIELAPLLTEFVKQLKRKGVSLFFQHPVAAIRSTPQGFIVKAGGTTFLTKNLVNAAGSWASLLAKKAKAQSIPLRSCRRHLFTSTPFRGVAASWPFVWDLSTDFYFRPSGNSLLLSPCDQVPVSAAIEKTDPRIQKLLFKKLRQFSDAFQNIHIQKSRAGLRTLSPDGRFVIGEDGKVKRFFWVAGLGGHGVTTCFAIGELASDLILGERTKDPLAKAFSPKRFLNGRGASRNS